MDTIRGYLLSVTAACLISVLAGALVRQKTVKKVVRFSSGLLILLVVVLPLLSLDMDDIADVFRSFRLEYNRTDGEQEWHAQLSRHIKQMSEAYIEDKAGELGASVRAEVTLNDDEYPQPVRVRISGILSRTQHEALAAYIRTAFGIAEEEQEWRFYEVDE